MKTAASSGGVDGSRASMNTVSSVGNKGEKDHNQVEVKVGRCCNWIGIIIQININIGINPELRIGFLWVFLLFAFQIFIIFIVLLSGDA